jgi:hypothetical protein
MIAPSPVDTFNRVLDPFVDCFTLEVAQSILAVRLDPQLQARLDELAAKANEGLLTEAENDEYGGYIEALDLVAILKAKARAVLSRSKS